jgi:chemosensory pili system protein ChpA (sensor histidine kinase/response regulator)
VSTEASIFEVFVAEAAVHLETLTDADAPEDEKRAAATNLREAAALLGEHAIARAAEALVESPPSPGEVAALKGLIDARAARRDEPLRAPGDAGELIDERGSLQRLFCDEADETLERIVRTLLGLSDRAPSPAVLSELMRTTHTLKGSAGTVELGSIGDAAHALEDVFDTLRAHGGSWSQSLCDRLVEAVDALRTAVEVCGDDAALREQLDRFYDHLSRLDLDTDAQARAPSEAAEGRAPDVPRVARRESDVTVLRIDARRIDRLMDSVGELAFDRTRITRRASEISLIAGELDRLRQRLPASIRRLEGASAAEARRQLADKLTTLDAELEQQLAALSQAAAALLEDADALRRTGKALQDGFTRVRMLTVSSIFRQLAPQLRAMARAAGKRIRLETSGGNTEFDKAVAAQIVDSLLQLLRNAVAHGIEAPEERLARGKPAEGRVSIAARQEGSTVVVEVADDGAGIDPAALRRRFVQSGRWTDARAQLASDREVMQALFEPGITQLDRADALAGRGVGLSAVRETVARLGGEIETRAVPGAGTRFTIRLPVTAAVSQALLFKIGGDVYALPQSYVLETSQVELAPKLPSHLQVQSGAVPLVCMQEVLEAELPAGASSLPAVVLAFAGKELAITCDKLVGPREIVIKQLGPVLSTLPLYAGGTISGSGKVQLILDPAALVRLAFPETAGAAAPSPRWPARERARTEDGPRALVVDDSPSVRESVARMLASAGYEIELAPNGARAWAMLHQARYDLVITDIEMPQLGGFDLLEKLRDDRELSDLPVIVISSRDTAEGRARAAALGARRFLTKPVDRDALLAAITQPEPAAS